MNKPTDYPIDPNSSDANTDPTAPDITFAVLRDRVNAKQPVTDEMIRTARTKLDTAHSDSNKASTSQTKLGKIRDRFRVS